MPSIPTTNKGNMEVAFHVVDYVIVGVFLLISLAIGVYYGVIRKQRTTEEYLFGNRQMSLVPVALSLLVTYNSGVSVVGVPAEMYLYDTMFFYSFIGIALANLIQYGIIVPLMYPLRLTSPYEVCHPGIKQVTAEANVAYLLGQMSATKENVDGLHVLQGFCCTFTF